jgi:DNA-directed RNA polymerase specialized sigma24 family protein
VNSKEENNKRLETLYKESHNWLVAATYNITKDKEVANDLVGELYVYLGEKVRPNLWWGKNSFNVMYAYAFLKSRYLNKVKRDKKIKYHGDTMVDDRIDEEYDIDFDERLDKCYEDVIAELKNMEVTKHWASSKLYQMYAFDPEMTLEKLASEIKISKSTAFLNVRKTKTHLKEKIKNPFRN